MTCPFLKEAQVKYCGTSSVRKLIPMAQAGRAEERCSSASYPACPVFRQQPGAREMAALETCPFLHESLMQYCAAASVTRLVPYSESLLSRCGNPSYRYCELYLQMAHPLPPAETVDGLPMPADLGYSANHMWLDTAAQAGGDGVCYAGIDAFLSRMLGPVERVSFVWQRGRHRPTAVVTAAGVDLEITLPFPMQLTNCNLYLRANPGRLISEPYTGGWLFEGVPEPGALDTLARGEQARHWMEGEIKSISEFLQHLPGPDGPTAADGGMFSAGLARYLEREQTLALFHEFFSPLREQEVRL
jgi:glycine cleavage system H lipoate-binding protein